MALKKNRTMVLRKDYENYLFKIPLEMLGRKSKSYISQELEKIHPGFCNTSVFDTHLFLKKGRLFASVVVMDRVVMEKYKARKGRSLFFEGFNGYAFGDHKKTVIASLMLVALTVICLLLAGTSAFRLLGAETGSESSESAEKYFLVEESKTVEEVWSVANGMDSLFDCLYFQNAVIDSACISNNMIQCHVHGCFPEKIWELKKDPWLMSVNISTEAVSYLNGEPFFSFTIESPATGSSLVEEMTALECTELDASVMEEIRMCLLESNVEILSENLTRREIGFALNEEQFDRCFLDLADFFVKKSLDVSGLELLSSGNALRVDLKWTDAENKEEMKVLDVLEKNGCLFFAKHDEPELEPIGFVEDEIFHEAEEKNNAVRKEGIVLGKISTSQGKLIHYIKIPEGKIIGVEDYEESE